MRCASDLVCVQEGDQSISSRRQPEPKPRIAVPKPEDEYHQEFHGGRGLVQVHARPRLRARLSCTAGVRVGQKREGMCILGCEVGQKAGGEAGFGSCPIQRKGAAETCVLNEAIQRMKAQYTKEGD
jgi:hypothetical protein